MHTKSEMIIFCLFWEICQPEHKFSMIDSKELPGPFKTKNELVWRLNEHMNKKR